MLRAQILLMLAFLGTHAGATVHYTYSGANPSIPSRTETASSCTTASAEYTTYAGIPEGVQINRIAVDASGTTLIAGRRLAPTIPNSFTANPFIARIDARGCLLFTVTIQADRYAEARAVAVDINGRIYVSGITGQSTNFPVRNALQDRVGAGFFLRLSDDGSQLLSSTYIDGDVNAMVLDPDANVYLTGQTGFGDFPDSLHASKIKPRSNGPSAVGAAFFMKLTPAGDRIVTSGYLAGDAVACGGGSSCFLSSRNTSGLAVAVDRDRNILFAGNTNITDLPTTERALRPKGIGAFVAKVRPDGLQLIYSTYLGDRNDPVTPFAVPANVLSDMTVDAAGNAVIVGKTYDENFPATAGVVQPAYSGPVIGQGGGGLDAQFDAFVAKLNATGTAVVWATYFGVGGRDENFGSVSSDNAGNLWLSGTANAHRAATSPSTLIVGLDSGASKILFSGLFAPGWGNVSVVDRSGLLHASGTSGLVSVFRPATDFSRRILGLTSGAGGEITGEIAPGEIVSVYGTGIGPDQPASFTLDENGRVPTTLSGVLLFFGDVPAPLLYVSQNQINAIVPNGLQPLSSVAIRVANDSQRFTARVFASVPAFFGGPGGYVVWNQDGSPNNQANPAPAGSVVTLWITGSGADSRPDGSVASGPRDTKCCQAMYQEQPLEVLYAGDSPGFVTALKQINVRVPPATGPIDIVTAGSRAISALVHVRPLP